MGIETISKTASLPYQQGSSAGMEMTKTAETKQPNAVKAEAPEKKSLDSSQLVESKRGDARESDSARSQNVSESQKDAELSKGSEALRKAVEEINKNVKNSEAIFGFHEKTNRVTIKIVDKTSKEVLKEFPPEKTLDMIAKVWEMAGLMVDQKL